MSDKLIEFDSLKEAEAFSAAMDIKAGYPKPALRVTKGKHVPPDQARTVRLADVVEYESKKQTKYGYPLSREVRSFQGESVEYDGKVKEVDATKGVARADVAADSLDLSKDP